MIKLVLTDMDGTFLNNSGDFNRELYKDVKKIMEEKGVIFAPVTGKQCERVEELRKRSHFCPGYRQTMRACRRVIW